MIEARLKELKIDLPAPTPPAANYAPFLKTGSILLVSGQLPLLKGEVHYKGKMGREFSLEDGQKAAYLCCLHIIAQVKEACEGDLNRVCRCLRLGGFINSTEIFYGSSQSDEWGLRFNDCRFWRERATRPRSSGSYGTSFECNCRN